MHFRIETDNYRGPIDLLLYLVRQHEVGISDISIAAITQQYLDYLAIIEQIDVNAVGDFIEVASLLIEIKSRSVLPTAEATDEPIENPREHLVARLLEYKKYKDVASMLEEQSLEWQQCFPRVANDLPPRHVNPTAQPIREVELWDLVSALGRVLRHPEVHDATNVVYDDVPIQTHMRSIYDKLCEQGRLGITEAFRAGMKKSVVIGVFLAVLELVRHHSVEAEQDGESGEIWVKPGENFAYTLELAEQAGDDYTVRQSTGT